MQLKKLKDKIIEGYRVTYHDALKIVEDADKEELYTLAGELRLHFLGKKFDTCSIMNARSGRCSENCKWCSQSVFHKTDIEIYPLVDINQALTHAMHNSNKGVGRFSLVTSGRTVSSSDMDKIVEIYNAIKEKSDISLCASMGLLDKKELQKLKNCGVVHYHCNLETAPSYFDKLCTTHTMEDKIRSINYAKEVGLKICSGGIIGMGESMEQRVELAIKLRDIEAVSIPINILNPIKGTPLEGSTQLTPTDMLTTFAIFRVINPDAMIRFAGGRSQILDIQDKAFQSGISGALVGDLLTTIGPDIDQDKQTIKRLGFTM